MSVGHIARVLEKGGIATVVIAAQSFEPRLTAMTLPRLVLTPYPMGRPLGAPGDVAGQRKTLDAALELLQTAARAGTVVKLNHRYQPT